MATKFKQAVTASPNTLARASSRALDPELADGVRDYMAAARAENTRKAYRQAWAQFETWCADTGRTALAADASTVAAWIVAMAKGINGRRLSRATINQYLAAVVLRTGWLATSWIARRPRSPRLSEAWPGARPSRRYNARRSPCA